MVKPRLTGPAESSSLAGKVLLVKPARLRMAPPLGSSGLLLPLELVEGGQSRGASLAGLRLGVVAGVVLVEGVLAAVGPVGGVAVAGALLLEIAVLAANVAGWTETGL